MAIMTSGTSHYEPQAKDMNGFAYEQRERERERERESLAVKIHLGF
jgi:hypothetical protein